MHPWTLYALEVARDRQREADRTGSPPRLEPDSRSAVAPPPPDSPAPRSLEPRTAAAVRRLDDCVADDLSRSLAATAERR